MAIPRRLVLNTLARTTCSACLRTKSPQLSAPFSPNGSKSTTSTYQSILRCQQRWHSAPPTTTKLYDFATMRNHSASPSPDRIIIDVREPSEYQAGYIPGAINIPIKSQPDALFLPAEEFEDRFGFSKPETDKEVVFYCRSGVRSSAAAQLARQHGYENVAEYRGSWLDWEKQGGEVAKP